MRPLTSIWVHSRMERWSELWNVRRIRARRYWRVIRRRARRKSRRRIRRLTGRRNTGPERLYDTTIISFQASLSRTGFSHPYYGSQRVWILQFSQSLNFIFLNLSSCAVPPEIYGILFTHVYVILLRKTQSRSSWKIIARVPVISWWFWFKYFAHHFILYSKRSKKKIQATYTVLNHSHISTLSSRYGLPVLRREEQILSLLSQFVTIRLRSTATLFEVWTSKTHKNYGYWTI